MGVQVGVVQPPTAVDGEQHHESIVGRGLDLVRAAADSGADIVCLPEYFAIAGLKDRSLDERADRSAAVVQACQEIARSHDTVVIAPSIEVTDGQVFNTAWVLGDEVIGSYRKVHLTLNERTIKGITAGDTFPVMTVAGIPIGIVTCYDLYFPEAARILALQGAKVLFVPSHQRAETAETISIQVRSRAIDNCVYVARASFGHEKDSLWRPGMVAGASSITDWEGRTVRDLGVREGYATVEIDPAGPPPKLRSYEGKPDWPHTYLFEDRRPDAYGELVTAVAPTRQ